MSKGNKKYYFHTDPGHGWVAVKRRELEELGVLHEISNYSYQHGHTVYLEEDRDATLWAEAYKGLYGRYPEYKSRHTDTSSPIRSYQSFRCA